MLMIILSTFLIVHIEAIQVILYYHSCYVYMSMFKLFQRQDKQGNKHFSFIAVYGFIMTPLAVVVGLFFVYSLFVELFTCLFNCLHCFFSLWLVSLLFSCRGYCCCCQ